jgi:hypothetical protein
VSKEACAAAKGSPDGAAGVLTSNPNILLVNRDNAEGFLSSTGMAKWILGHESLHTGGVKGHAHGTNQQPSYKWGGPLEREAFKQVSGTPAAANDPDHIIEHIYPSFQGPE